MTVIGGPNVIQDGLVFVIDAANRKSISPLGCTGFNNAPQLIKNILSPSSTISSYNDIRLGNVNFYTVFAIDYPESSFGGDAASREGITPGYDVRSGTKTYDASRALHLWVWNNDTDTWVPSSYFNGLRLSGHSYDSYLGYGSWQTEVAKFVTDFNNIKNAFPNCTYVVCGSHRDSGHTTDKINILLDLGAPSNVSSLLDSSPEWVLVGKPGLGAGNAYGWAYENYSTDPTRVAHLNFGLPIFGTKDNYLKFDGTDDYISLPNDLGYTTSVSAFAWFKSLGTPAGNYHIIFGGAELEISVPTAGQIRTGIYTNTRYVSNHGSGLTDGNWHNIGFTFSGTTKTSYIDGISVGTQTTAGTLTSTFSNRTMGRYGNNSTYYLNGNIASAQIYNRVLSPQEIQQNYNATKSRYGL